MAKRAFDLIFTVIGLLVLAPVFVVISIIIKLDSKGEVFFRQKRVGLHGREFRIFKFRTMESRQKDDGLKITVGRDRRITKIGYFLRKYKIDELPQLINILLGQMSFVGPRPEVAEYVEKYSESDRKLILSVRPGVTDLASIAFRDENEILSEEDDPEKAYVEKILPRKIKYCRFYIKKQSLMYDIEIIIKTLKAIIWPDQTPQN